MEYGVVLWDWSSWRLLEESISEAPTLQLVPRLRVTFYHRHLVHLHPSFCPRTCWKPPVGHEKIHRLDITWASKPEETESRYVIFLQCCFCARHCFNHFSLFHPYNSHNILFCSSGNWGPELLRKLPQTPGDKIVKMASNLGSQTPALVLLLNPFYLEFTGTMERDHSSDLG